MRCSTQEHDPEARTVVLKDRRSLRSDAYSVIKPRTKTWSTRILTLQHHRFRKLSVKEWTAGIARLTSFLEGIVPFPLVARLASTARRRGSWWCNTINERGKRDDILKTFGKFGFSTPSSDQHMDLTSSIVSHLDQHPASTTMPGVSLFQSPHIFAMAGEWAGLLVN